MNTTVQRKPTRAEKALLDWLRPTNPRDLYEAMDEIRAEERRALWDFITSRPANADGLIPTLELLQFITEGKDPE